MIYEQEHSIFDKNSLYKKFSSIDTSFEVTNGKIASIISDAEIDEYVDGSKTIFSQLNSRISTVEGYKEQISSIQTQVDSDGESINQITSKITEIEASDSEYRISTNETISGIQDGMSGLSDRVSNAELSLQPDNIVISARKSSLYSSDLSDATNNAVSTTKSWAQSELQIRDDSIAACVKESDVDGNYVVGKINLNSTTAKIQARNIDLEGQLTVSAFNQDTQSIINSHDMRFFTTNYAWTQAQIDNVSDIGHVTTWTVNEAVDTVAVGNTVMLSLRNTTKNITSYIMATVTQIYSVANKQIRCKFIGVLEKGIDGVNGIDGKDGVNGKDGTNGKDGKDGATGPQGPQGPAGKDGTNGTPATVYELIVSSSVISKNESGVYTPKSITLNSKKIIGNGSPSAYSGRFKIETTVDGSSWTTNPGYTSSSDQSSYTYTIPAGIKALRCSLYLAGGTVTLLDQQAVPVVSDGLNGANGADGKDGKDGKDGINGTNGVDGKDGKDGINGTNGVDGKDGADGKDAYTVILTNENHTFAGGVSSALGGSAECGVIAYKGASQIPSTIGSITGLPSSGMSVSISNNNTVSAKFTVTVNTEMVTKNGVLTVPITVDGKTFSKRFTYSLALKGTTGPKGDKGDTGANGTPATVYDLIVSSSVINKNVSGVYNPTTLTLTAQKIVGNGSPASYSGRFKIETSDGSSWVMNPGYTSSSDQSSYTYTIPAGIKALRCSLYLAGGTTTLLDQQTVPIVSDGLNGTNGTNGKDGKDGTNGTNGVDGKDGKDGTNGTNGVDGKDAYTVILTNENHTFAGGTAAALGGSAECSVIAYKGASQIPVRIGSITGLPSSGMSVSISNNNTVSAKFTVTVNTEMVSKNGVLTVPITVDGKSFSKKFTYSLALKGTTGDKGDKGDTGAKGDKGDSGAKGDTGFQGVSIVSTQMQYYLSTSNTSQTGGSWQDAPPSYVTGRYYWERAKTTLNDPSKSGSAATSYAYSTAVLSRGLNTAISNAKTAQDAADAVDAIIRDWASANDTTLIDGAKIYTGTVTTDKLAARSITAEKIASEAVMANHLRADTLVGKELYVTDTSGRTGWTTTIYYRNSSASTMNDRIANRDSSTWYTTIPAYQASYPYLWAYAKIGSYKSIPVCVAKRSSATSFTWYHNVNVSEGRIWSAMNECYILFDSVSNSNKPERLALMSSEGEVSVGKYNAGDELSAGDASVNIWGKKNVHIQSNTDVDIVSMNDVSIVAGSNKALHVYGDIVIHRGTIRYDR